jgi:hypothetical protein
MRRFFHRPATKILSNQRSGQNHRASSCHQVVSKSVDVKSPDLPQLLEVLFRVCPMDPAVRARIPWVPAWVLLYEPSRACTQASSFRRA